MQELLDHLEESIMIIKNSGEIEYCNLTAGSIFAVKKGTDVSVIFKEDDKEIFFKNLIRIIKNNGKYDNFIRLINKDNDIIFCWLSAFGLGGNMVFEIFDLTKTKTSGVNINDDDYVKLLKYMSEGIAHSIRNPIMSAGGILNRLKTKLPKDTPDSVISYIEMVEKSLFRIMHIIANIEVISNSLPTTLKKMRINTVIKNVVDKYKDKQNILFKVDAEDDIELFADDIHISFVIEEIIKNSIDAIGNSEGIVEIIVYKEDNDAVITIADNGPGIAQDDMPLVVIPFYSTKPSNMGIGLSLSKFVIEGYGGKINITSNEKEGTKVKLRLPIEKRNELRREVINV